MYEQHIQDDLIFVMFYAGVTVTAIIASCYLLLRQGNAFAPDITPPRTLRRWTAAFFAVMAMGHIWYIPIIYLDSYEAVKLNYLIGGLLDSMTIFPLAIVILLVMLQDRKRPLWPVAAITAPVVAAMAWSVFNRSEAIFPMIYAYLLLLCIALIIYMVREVRRYSRWLRDNYADLEHKEVWQSFIVLAVILLTFHLYSYTTDEPAYKYIMQVISLVLIGYLLWRVETLSDLSISQPQSLPAAETAAHDNIGLLLQQHCIDTQLFLQHDLTLQQLAKAIGTNRLYLSQYFSGQGLTYNTYINDLRINHFVKLYREAIAAHSPFTAQQLAHDSGYRSYSTFSLAFKQRMGQTVTAWMRGAGTI